MDAVRQIVGLLLLLMMPLCVTAQSRGVIRGNCTPGLAGTDDQTISSSVDRSGVRKAPSRQLPTPKIDWDPNRIYRQPVILIAFSDKDFSLEHPRETYDSIFNYPGFNMGAGPGCVADYFREQSGGLFNLQFDVFGPYKITQKAKRQANANENTREYGTYAMLEATQMWIAEDTSRQHGDYDWNGDKNIDQIIYVHAGFAGNQSDEKSYGHIWPNTSSFSYAMIQTHDDYWIPNYTCSGEMQVNGKSWGIGTICHEFSHLLGLPDIYPVPPVQSAGYSVVDEWDLMDGGNFTNSGWCPPNYSGLERMLMGWQSPIELTTPATITGMKALSEGGPVYMIRHTDSEYYLLENRQWSRWDQRLPGRGLVVFHVDYDRGIWAGNGVNEKRNHRRYQLVNADGMDYDAWDKVIGDENPYVKGHSRYLSTSPYPWATDSTDFVNDLLTDSSNPASVMFNNNAAGSKFLSKALTNIRMTDDGLISFDFMGGDPSAVQIVRNEDGEDSWYSLQGRRILGKPQRRGIYIHNGKKESIR